MTLIPIADEQAGKGEQAYNGYYGWLKGDVIFDGVRSATVWSAMKHSGPLLKKLG
jgi:hypothetical protein